MSYFKRFQSSKGIGGITQKSDVSDSINDSMRYIIDRVRDTDLPVARTVIDWTAEKGLQLLEAFKSASYPYRNYLDHFLIEGFGRELQFFAISLDSYIESSKALRAEQIIYLASLGSEGSKALKQLRVETFKRKIDAISFEDPEIHPLLSDLKIDCLEDIDDIFNYRCMPLWREEVNDFEENSYIPVKTSDKMLNSFRDTLRDILKGVKANPEDDRIDILLQSSRSISLDKGVRKFNFLRSQKSLSLSSGFSPDIGQVERCIIPVNPQGFRDTVILDWRSINTVKLIEKRVCYILRQLPYHNYTDNWRDFQRTIERFYKRDHVFVCRDLKKEGLTKPRILLKIMLEELSRIDNFLEPYIDFYESFEVKGFPKPLRGHGQGMANALTTLMQITIVQMVKNTFLDRGFDPIIESLNYNDDNMYRISPDIVDEFWDIEGEIMEGIGLIRSDKKSFWSDQGYIFCEIYISPFYPNLNKRNHVNRRLMLNSLLWKYPYEVKEYLKGNTENVFFNQYLPEIIHRVGYEFFPEEVNYPLSIGGWKPDKILGLSTALIDLEELPYDVYIEKMYRSSRITSVRIDPPDRYKKKFKKDKGVYNRIFSPDIIPDIKKYLPSGSLNDLYHRYSIWREDVHKQSEMRKNIHLQRQKIYKERVENPLSFVEFQRELLATKRYIVPRHFCKWEDPEFFVTNIDRDPYRQDTPILNFLLKMGVLVDHNSPFIEEYSISMNEDRYSLTKDEIYLLYAEEMPEDFDGRYPFSEASFYQADRKVGFTANFLLAHYLIMDQLPLVGDLFDDIPYKKEVYKEYLPLSLYIEYANIDYDRWDYELFKTLEALIEESGLTEDEISDLIQETISESRPVENPVDEDSSDESIDEESYYSIVKKYGGVRKKTVTPDDLPNLLLGKISPDDYEWEDEIARVVYPCMRYYYHSDSLPGDRVEKLKRDFESFLSNPILKQLLMDSLEQGYLKEIGIALDLIEDKSEDEDYGMGGLF